MAGRAGGGGDAGAVVAFFADTPAFGAEIAEQVSGFVSRFSNTSTPIVVVTSGGTKAPLERQCVRFIDTFSAGTREALSAERFLEAGYAVIFLTRTGSLQPFAHMLPAADPPELVDTVACLADEAAAAADSSSGGGGGGTAPPPTVRIRPQHEEAVARVLAARRRCREAGTLLTIKYDTIFQYLAYLRTVAEALRPLGARAMFYLAAAVSHYYIPWGQLGEHMTESANGPLELRLHKVPKMLGVLSGQWAPKAFMVGFKSDSNKAWDTFNRCDVNMVVADLPHDSHGEVRLLERVMGIRSARSRAAAKAAGRRDWGILPPTPDELFADPDAMQVSSRCVRRPDGEPHIERQLVAEVVERHQGFMTSGPRQFEGYGM